MSNAALNAVFLFSQSKSGERALLLAIADGINETSGTTPPKQETLAIKANISVRRTRTLLTRLVGMGELVIKERHGYSGLYSIPLLWGEEGYAPEDCQEEHFCNGHHTPLWKTRESVSLAGRKARRKASEKPKTGGTRVPPEPEQGFPYPGTHDPTIPSYTQAFTHDVPSDPPQFDLDEFNRWLRDTHIDIRNGKERHAMIARYKREKGIPA